MSQLFLMKLASLSLKEREFFSREETKKTLNELKYLSSQKKIPRISLRKEVVHLENLLNGVFALDDSLRKREKQESARIAVLKKQILTLRRQLAASKDRELHQKVEKLSHLIGDHHARMDSKAWIAESHRPIPSQQELMVAKNMQQRLEAMKQELEIARAKKDAAQKVALLEQRIQIVEAKVKEFMEKNSEAWNQSYSLPQHHVPNYQPVHPPPIDHTLQPRLEALTQELEIAKTLQTDASKKRIPVLEQQIAQLTARIQGQQTMVHPMQGQFNQPPVQRPQAPRPSMPPPIYPAPKEAPTFWKKAPVVTQGEGRHIMLFGNKDKIPPKGELPDPDAPRNTVRAKVEPKLATKEELAEIPSKAPVEKDKELAPIMANLPPPPKKYDK